MAHIIQHTTTNKIHVGEHSHMKKPAFSVNLFPPSFYDYCPQCGGCLFIEESGSLAKCSDCGNAALSWLEQAPLFCSSCGEKFEEE